MKTITTCSGTVDYSKVTGDRILPFVFVLNETESVLHPAEGENQKFCYDVAGVGTDTSQYADLSHFLLGICKDITPEDIISVTVVINGVSQDVVWGENVEIKTEEKPDPPTGCAGIKIDFPLDKVDGEMQVCITLAKTYAIGPVNVCVFGGNTTATGLTICGPVCQNLPSCESTFYQKETVCVPVTVTPFATSKSATARCCGSTVVAKQDSCPLGEKTCTFTVTQPLCIEIAIEFGADIDTGEASVICGDVSEEGCSCGDTASTVSNTTTSIAATNEYISTARKNRFLNR